MDACIVDVTLEFLAVAFHNILYYASVYPRNIFETRKKYNVVVYRCSHPTVCSYMDNCLEVLAEALKSGELHRVELVVTDMRYKPGVKFVFDFERMATFDETTDSYLVRHEQNMRAFCLLLSTMSQKFKSFPAESTFEIRFTTNESIEVALASLPQLENIPFIEVEDVDYMDNIMPLRRFSIRNYNIDTYIELPKTCTFFS